MKDEAKRIIKLVQDGKLNAEDAAELIEAFAMLERERDATDMPEDRSERFRTFIEAMKTASKEACDGVNWDDAVRGERARGSRRRTRVFGVYRLCRTARSGRSEQGWSAAAGGSK